MHRIVLARSGVYSLYTYKRGDGANVRGPSATRLAYMMEHPDTGDKDQLILSCSYGLPASMVFLFAQACASGCVIMIPDPWPASCELDAIEQAYPNRTRRLCLLAAD